MQIFEDSYGLNLSLQIRSIFKEATFVKFVKLIPYLLSIVFSFLIDLRFFNSFIFLQFLLRLFLHFFSQLVEYYFLFRSSMLVKFIFYFFFHPFLGQFLLLLFIHAKLGDSTLCQLELIIFENDFIIQMKDYTLFLFFVILLSTQVNGHLFCTWAEKPIKLESKTVLNNQNRQTKEPKPAQANIVNENKLNDKQRFFFSLLNKKDQFKSYHPHYLHSYSYPQPLTPHIYFGQMGKYNLYSFLIKDNETIAAGSVANQIFYVNGQYEQGSNNVLLKPNLRVNQADLNFAMVVQIENLSQLPIQTKLTVYNFGYFYGILCELSPGYMKSFIVYISESGKKPMNLNQNHPQLFTLEIKNLATFNNNMNWKYAHQPMRIRYEQKMQLPEGTESPNMFNTFVLTIKYTSLDAAQLYKVAVRQFPYNTKSAQDKAGMFSTVQETLAAMKLINITSSQYQFQVIKDVKKDSCQVKAEKQLLKGLSYQFGDLVLKNGSRHLANEPKQLFSFTPSRKRFPWGFLWDDGFHCEVAARTQPLLALKVIKSWLDTMHEIGWIPREQNRGAQRQFLCNCPQFMAKDIRDGNPPTLLLGLNYLARQNLLSSQNFQKIYWEKLKSWYNWFMETQSENKQSYVFRWYDSIPGNGSFNSGMDDFPRLAQSYGHVDCQAWMYFFATTMSLIRDKLGLIEGNFLEDANKIKTKLLQKFVQPESKILYDYTIEGKFNMHFGYPSLLPIAFGMLHPDDEIFKSTIQKLRNQLNSGFGITSISQRDPQYLTSGAYWRGPVWININFLVLRGLFLYYKTETELYRKLRADIIQTVCGYEEKKGYFFENYIQGKGSFSYPFTGWTALISVIVRENY